MNYHNDTITALSTPTGCGALHIIRVSGFDAIEQVAKIFKPANKLLRAKGHTLVYGKIYNGNDILDEVLCSVFRTPNSFTGENSVEISCHGSMFVAESILSVLQKSIRLANPGEFTLRAFLNNKLDLTQAEAVNDMIQAKTRKSQALAINQLDGSLYNRIGKLLERITNYRIQLELEIDFLDDDVPAIDLGKLRNDLLALQMDLEKLVDSGRHGRIIREGLKVSLIGEPNVGKSSIFNKLLESERAIVTPIPGTTRDYLEETISLDGYLVKIYDTAGLRETEDTVEKIGIARSKEVIENSDYIVSVETLDERQDCLELSSIPEAKLIKVLNKSDLLDDTSVYESQGYILTSAVTIDGILSLKKKLLEKVILSDNELSSGILTNSRQMNAVEKCIELVKNAILSIDNSLGYEFTAFDLREASEALEEIIGKVTDDDLLNKIFSNFCIGK